MGSEVVVVQPLCYPDALQLDEPEALPAQPTRATRRPEQRAPAAVSVPHLPVPSASSLPLQARRPLAVRLHPVASAAAAAAAAAAVLAAAAAAVVHAGAAAVEEALMARVEC